MAINIAPTLGRLYRILSMETSLFPCTYRYLSHLIRQWTIANTKEILLSRLFKNIALGSESKLTIRRFAKTLSISELTPVSLHEMKKFLTANKVIFEHGYTCLIVTCPFCPHRRENSSKSKKLYINIVTGMFLCYGCHLKGTWLEFQDYIHTLRSNQLQGIVTKSNLSRGFAVPLKDKLYIDEIFESSQPLESLQISHYEDVIHKFGLKGLNPSSCSKFELRILPDESRLILPIYDIDSTKAGLRFLFPKGLEEQCQTITEDVTPKTARELIFGWQKISSNHREVVLTAFPLDAIIVNQEVGVPSLSLPRGITSLPQEVLPLLEQFKRIVLWFGNKVSEWEAARMFAKKLGERRCFFIRPRDSNPRPIIAVQKGFKLSSILQECYPIGHKAITSFSSLREDVLAELSNAEQVAGVKWQRYPSLNKLLKGHRRGELTVVTGPTGSGKTTFISEYSLDLCIQGVNTLWGSFEIKNVRLAKMMLNQFAQIPLKLNLDQYNYWADRFEQLPMYYMTFHGQQTLKNVLEAMTHAVYVHDIQHVIVDNLQFMMGVGDNESHFDRFWRQDQIITSFRKFATTSNVHVTLVIHPRKERETDELNNLSIFGGAKASQEADNILILQDKRLSTLRGRKYIQVTKNRYDGDLGIMPLEFDKETLSFAIKKKPKKYVDKTEKIVKDDSTQ